MDQKLKVQWKTVCHDFFQANPGRLIAKFNFVSLFVYLLFQQNIVSGFRICGAYPLNVSAIQARPEGRL